MLDEGFESLRIRSENDPSHLSPLSPHQAKEEELVSFHAQQWHAEEAAREAAETKAKLEAQLEEVAEAKKQTEQQMQSRYGERWHAERNSMEACLHTVVFGSRTRGISQGKTFKRQTVKDKRKGPKAKADTKAAKAIKSAKK